jgi:hypothetical protein
MIEHASTTKSYERTVEFINRVTNAINEPLSHSSFSCINSKGEFSSLKDHHKEILKWENIGIAPNIKRKEFKANL